MNRGQGSRGRGGGGVKEYDIGVKSFPRCDLLLLLLQLLGLGAFCSVDMVGFVLWICLGTSHCRGSYV